MPSVLWKFKVDPLFIQNLTHFQHLIGLQGAETPIFFLPPIASSAVLLEPGLPGALFRVVSP
jgi:hypothetical protein